MDLEHLTGYQRVADPLSFMTTEQLLSKLLRGMSNLENCLTAMKSSFGETKRSIQSLQVSLQALEFNYTSLDDVTEYANDTKFKATLELNDVVESDEATSEVLKEQIAEAEFDVRAFAGDDNQLLAKDNVLENDREISLVASPMYQLGLVSHHFVDPFLVSHSRSLAISVRTFGFRRISCSVAAQVLQFFPKFGEVNDAFNVFDIMSLRPYVFSSFFVLGNLRVFHKKTMHISVHVLEKSLSSLLCWCDDGGGWMSKVKWGWVLTRGDDGNAASPGVWCRGVVARLKSGASFVNFVQLSGRRCDGASGRLGTLDTCVQHLLVHAGLYDVYRARHVQLDHALITATVIDPADVGALQSSTHGDVGILDVEVTTGILGHGIANVVSLAFVGTVALVRWRTLHKGAWSTVLSPYKDSHIDVKFTDDISGAVTITLEFECQRGQLFAVALGFILLLSAPLISSQGLVCFCITTSILPKIAVGWVHVIGKRWASSPRGFMGVDECLQHFHFNCLRLDDDGYLINMSLPVVVAIDDETKEKIGPSCDVALMGSNGDYVAILKSIEIYKHNKKRESLEHGRPLLRGGLTWRRRLLTQGTSSWVVTWKCCTQSTILMV